jgi:hypothetical protein
MSPEAKQPIAEDYLILNPGDVVIKTVLENMGLTYEELENDTEDARDFAAKKLSDSINSIAEVKPGPKSKHVKKIRPKKYAQIDKPDLVSASKTNEYRGAIQAQILGGKIIRVVIDDPDKVHIAEKDFKILHYEIKKASHAMTSDFAKDDYGVRGSITEEDELDAEPVTVDEV